MPDSIGYLKTRRVQPFGVVDSEANLQDLVYLSLKPYVRDLQYEIPTNKGAAPFSIGAFWMPSLSLFIECKYVGRREDVKRVADEISEDIWKYSTQTSCERMLFVAYDPGLHIPDRPQFVRGVSAKPNSFKAGGRGIIIDTMIVPA